MSTSPSLSTFAHGDLVLGKYRVRGELGAGGMGRVVEAEHIELGRLVALKVLHPELASRPGFSERFIREARIVAHLASPHVARVLDVDRLPDGTPVLVLERLHGCDLDARCAEQGPCSTEDAVLYVLQAADALDEAHAHGVVHRDVKPSNLFLARDPEHGEIVKVLDFGVAKLAADGALTATGQAVGSPRYMAPEQVRRAPEIDRRADVWALGVTLARLVGDRHPFEGEDAVAVAASVLERAPDLGDVRDAALAAVVTRCLEKRPEDRYADLGELVAALAPIAGERGHAARAAFVRRSTSRALTPRPAAVTAPTDRTQTFALPGDATAASTGRTSTTPPAPHRGRWVLLAVGAIALISLFAIARPHSGPAPNTVASSPPRALPSPPAAASVDVTVAEAPSAEASTRRVSPRPVRPSAVASIVPAAAPADPVKPEATTAPPPPPVAVSVALPVAPAPRDPLGDRK